MRRALLAVVATAVLLFTHDAHTQSKPDPNIASTDPRTPAEEIKAFRLPPGFEAQLVAADPDIHKPLNLNFDDRGRLWVTDTVEYPFPVGPDKKGRDTVKILEDFGPDGRARKITTFADGLNIPIGVVPLSSSKEALVYSVPSIYRLRDTKGTGSADVREKIYAEFGTRDTHGMTNAFTRGFDGWIYATHGFSNTSTVKAGDGSAVTMTSGNTYRMKADGSHVEQWTWGQVNPFGLAFDPLGNLYSCDCHSQPIYQLLRGAHYPSFGRPHDGLGFGPETYTNYQESTAIAGIAYYAADYYPKEYHDCAFIGDVVTNRVNLFRLHWHGSSTKATLERFLQSDDPWFRPVDVKLGPDGALYVADFYNRIIGHYEVPLNHPGRDRERGRIWRIVYKGTDGKKVLPPLRDWTKASVEELVSALGDPNLTVRLIAANQLVERKAAGAEAVRRALLTTRALQTPGRDFQMAHSLWVLERLGELKDDTLAIECINRTEDVRVHAQRILGERAKWTLAQHDLALAGLKDKSANVQRAAADALGRHPAAANIRALLELRHAVPAEDTHLLHVVRMALRDQLRGTAAWDALAKETLSPADNAAIADVALGVTLPQSATFLLHYLTKKPDNRDLLLRAVQHVARLGDAETLSQLWAFVQEHRPDDLGLQVALFRAVEHGTQERGVKIAEPVHVWAVDLTNRLLHSRNGGEVQAGIELVGSLRLQSQQEQLVRLASERSVPEGQRAAALNALATIDARKHAAVLGAVLGDSESPIALRENTAGLLAKANQPETLDELVKALASAPARLQNSIAANLAGSPAGTAKLLDAVAAGKASARLLQDRAVEVKLANSKLPNVKERVAKLTKGLPAADQQIQALMQKRRAGYLAAKSDVALGAKVFEKSCAICHQIGGKGEKIGPQLDGIGIRGLDRLLEDVLDPNRNVDQAFRATTLNLKDGKLLFGLVLREEGEVVVLADAKGKEVRVEKSKIDERIVSQQSPMPANLSDDVKEADFYHLMAFLLSKKDAPPK